MHKFIIELTQMNTNKKLKIMFVWFVSFVFILTSCVSTPRVDYGGLGNPDDLAPFNTKVLTGYLPNGLRYYILENSLPENRAHAGLVVNAGSVLEKDDQRGFAHFIEHLAFSDTVRFPDLQIQEYLRSLGMRFGPDFNANTSHERTLYYFDIPVELTDGIKRIPEKGLAILDDWTHGVTFKNEFVESERRVILEEMRARSGAGERIRKILYPLLFAGSAYEDRDVIGLEETIINATQKSLKTFYDRWYYSDNMAIIFIGDFDGKTLEAELANHFTMPLVTHRAPRPVYELPPPVNGNFHAEIITDPEIISIDYSIYFKQNKGPKTGTLAAYRESIIDYLISTMINQRFDETSRNPASSSTGSWGSPWHWAGSSKFYVLGSQAKTGMAEQALSELLAEMEYLRRGFGFTESELNRAKLNLVSYMERQLSEKDRRESRSFLRSFVSHFMYGEDFSDIEWEVEAVNTLLPGISTREIAQAAKNYFSYNDIVVVLTAPEAEKDNLPSAEQIRQTFNNAKRMRIIQRQNEVFDNELISSLPPAGNIVKETIDEETGSVILELSNGARIILKQTENRNNEVTMYAMSRGGTLNASLGEKISADLLSEMIQVSGLGPYSRTELDNILAGKQVSFSFWNSSYYRGFQGSSTTQDLQTLFEMLYLFFTNPRLEEMSITAMLEQYKTHLIRQADDPQRFFFNEITKIMTDNHPLFKPIELADIDNVSITEAGNYLSECLNPADYTFVFTGNFDTETIKEYALMYIATVVDNDYIFKEDFNKITDPGINRPVGTQHTIYKGKDDRSMVYLSWYAPAENQFNERKNQASAILSEYLDIVLTDEIREKLGGVYGISSGASVSVIPRGEYSLYVYFVCNPERAEELSSAVVESLQNIINQPLNQDVFNQAKEALLMQHERSIQRNLHIAQSYSNSAVLYDTPLARLNARPGIIRLVTPEEVQELCREMLAASPIKAVLYPESRE